MTKPTLYLIHGYIASGKTTYARKLEIETCAVRFTADEWMIHFYGSNPDKEQFAQYEENIKTMIWHMTEKFLQKGNSVILDYGFWKRVERDEYYARANNLNVACELHALNCDEKTALNRLAVRTSQMPKDALFVDENAYRLLKAGYEPIEKDERSHQIEKSLKKRMFV